MIEANCVQSVFVGFRTVYMSNTFQQNLLDICTEWDLYKYDKIWSRRYPFMTYYMLTYPCVYMLLEVPASRQQSTSHQQQPAVSSAQITIFRCLLQNRRSANSNLIAAELITFIAAVAATLTSCHPLT